MSWFKGLGAAAIGGMATAVMGHWTSPEVVAELGWVPMLKIAGGAAMFHAMAYLKQSPLPGVKR